MKVTGKVSGFDEFGKLLKELPAGVEKRVLQQATMDTLREVLPEMKAAAPEGLPEDRSPSSKRYGTLKKNIRVGKKSKVKKGQKGARIHTGNAFWGFIYEKGSRYQPARPFFAPKFFSLQSKMIKILGVKIGDGIVREAEKFKGGRK